MRKIISGMLGIVMTAAVVGGVAYAAFSSQATVNGINIQAGNASLLVGPHSGTLVPSFNAGLTLNHLFPGYGVANDQFVQFDVRNDSTDVALAVTAQLTAADGWGTTGVHLPSSVELAINTNDDLSGTGYHSLADWNSGAIALPGAAIPSHTTVTYKAYLRVPSSVGNEIQGEYLENITFTLIGTQTP